MIKFISGKIEFTTAMIRYAEENFEKKITKNFPEFGNAEVKLSNKDSKNRFKVEISTNGFRAQSINVSYYDAVLDSLAKLHSMILKSKKKLIDCKRKTSLPEFPECYISDETSETLISKEKFFVLSSETVDQAIEEFEKTDYTFYVFRDADDKDTVTILYRRYDDTYGLIRCH